MAERCEKMKTEYRTKGVCASSITINVDDGLIKDVAFVGGCDGNLIAISKLVEGMKVTQAIDKLSGIRCGMKSTSCPDQLAKALSELENK